MATIIEVELPEEYKNKNKYEIYTHLEKVATYAHNLKQEIKDLQAEIKLRDAQLQKQRGDILQLKSFIGHQNIEINDLKVKNVIEDAEYEVINEDLKLPNFLPPSVKFQEVKGKVPK